MPVGSTTPKFLKTGGRNLTVLRAVAVSRGDCVKMPRKVFFFKGFLSCVEQSMKADKGLYGWGVLCQVALLELLRAAPPPAEQTGKRHKGQSLALTCKEEGLH